MIAKGIVRDHQLAARGSCEDDTSGDGKELKGTGTHQKRQGQHGSECIARAKASRKLKTYSWRIQEAACEGQGEMQWCRGGNNEGHSES